jgi:hypothetical protein
MGELCPNGFHVQIIARKIQSVNKNRKKFEKYRMDTQGDGVPL